MNMNMNMNININTNTNIKEMYKMYEYLLDNVLCSYKNMDKLRNRTKEVYFELLNESNCPRLSRIADIIDSENIITIQKFFSSYSYHENYIDSILATYSHDIGCFLDDYIESILIYNGFPFSGSMFIQNSLIQNKLRSSYSYSYQNILIDEFLRSG